jgi:hypothetical protein
MGAPMPIFQAEAADRMAKKYGFYDGEILSAPTLRQKLLHH